MGAMSRYKCYSSMLRFQLFKINYSTTPYTSNLYKSIHQASCLHSKNPPMITTAPPNKPIYSLPTSHLLTLSSSIHSLLSETPYNNPQPHSPSIKSLLQSLLPQTNFFSPKQTLNLFLCLSFLTSAEGDDSPSVYWIPNSLSSAAMAAFREISDEFYGGDVYRLVVDLMGEGLPELKGVIKESCVDVGEGEEEFVAGSAKAPVEKAVVAARQFRWLVAQVAYPHLGKLCCLVIPCALTALDHWSPEVKEQGMLTFIHLGKNVNPTELSWYEEPILDACCRNIASSDELWQHVVEMSVLLLTCTQQRNPRSSWYECMLSEMLSHLERQPFNKDRRITWLLLIEPVFDAMGLVLLAHFRRIFSLFFQWMHADDDETVLLVMDCLYTIIKLTWIRKSPYIDKLVDEMILLYKETAMRKNRDVIRNHILQMLFFLQTCKGLQFETAWNKHKNDPDLTMLISSFNDRLNEIFQLQDMSLDA